MILISYCIKTLHHGANVNQRRHWCKSAPTCTNRAVDIALAPRCTLVQRCTYTSQLDGKRHQIALVVDEVREVSVHRVTFHGDIRGPLLVTWQQDGGHNENLSAIVLIVIDGFVETNCQLFVIGENFCFPRITFVILYSIPVTVYETLRWHNHHHHHHHHHSSDTVKATYIG